MLDAFKYIKRAKMRREEKLASSPVCIKLAPSNNLIRGRPSALFARPNLQSATRDLRDETERRLATWNEPRGHTRQRQRGVPDRLAALRDTTHALLRRRRRRR